MIKVPEVRPPGPSAHRDPRGLTRIGEAVVTPVAIKCVAARMTAVKLAHRFRSFRVNFEPCDTRWPAADHMFAT